MPAQFKDLCFDANDHQRLADWWCRALGYQRIWVEDRPVDAPVPIADPDERGPLLWINPVPEAKTAKNRVHVDLFGDSDELVALGATVVRRRDDERNWDVLADPEGNEFCVFPPHR